VGPAVASLYEATAEKSTASLGASKRGGDYLHRLLIHDAPAVLRITALKQKPDLSARDVRYRSNSSRVSR
jgi:hypothetical protein